MEVDVHIDVQYGSRCMAVVCVGTYGAVRIGWLWSTCSLTVKPMGTSRYWLASTRAQVRALVEERCDLHVGIANSNDDISGCGGWF